MIGAAVSAADLQKGAGRGDKDKFFAKGVSIYEIGSSFIKILRHGIWFFLPVCYNKTAGFTNPWELREQDELSLIHI